MLTVTRSCHGMPCVELHNASERVQRIIKCAVLANHMDDIRYKLGKRAGAFLQGHSEQDGSILVEFWNTGYQPFVDLLNKLIEEDATRQNGDKKTHKESEVVNTKKMLPVRVGTLLYGYCGGEFGRNSYGTKRVEAIGADWVVARECDDSNPEDNPPLFANCDPDALEEYTVKPEED